MGITGRGAGGGGGGVAVLVIRASVCVYDPHMHWLFNFYLVPTSLVCSNMPHIKLWARYIPVITGACYNCSGTLLWKDTPFLMR